MENTLEEIITFEHKIILSFCDLNNLKNVLDKKISETDFIDKTFDVKKILKYEIFNMMIVENTIVCLTIIEALCNNPVIGKIFKIDNFEIRKNNILFSLGKIQLICKKSENEPIKTSYQVQINAIKTISKNILCVGTIIE